MKKLIVLFIVFLTSCSTSPEDLPPLELKPAELDKLADSWEFNSYEGVLPIITYTREEIEIENSVNAYSIKGQFDYDFNFNISIVYKERNTVYSDVTTRSFQAILTSTYSNEYTYPFITSYHLTFSDGEELTFYFDDSRTEFYDNTTNEPLVVDDQLKAVLVEMQLNYLDDVMGHISSTLRSARKVISIIADKDISFPNYKSSSWINSQTLHLHPNGTEMLIHSISINEEEAVEFKDLDPLSQSLSILYYADNVKSVNEIPDDAWLLWTMLFTDSLFSCDRSYTDYDIIKTSCTTKDNKPMKEPDFSSLYPRSYSTYSLEDIINQQQVLLPQFNKRLISENKALSLGVIQNADN